MALGFNFDNSQVSESPEERATHSQVRIEGQDADMRPEEKAKE